MAEEKLQEAQFLEQNLQSIILQKQAFQMESAETKAAIKELEKSGDEVFKIIGQMMIKSDKAKMKEELENKEKLIDTRLKNLQIQETNVMKELDSMRKETVDSKK